MFQKWKKKLIHFRHTRILNFEFVENVKQSLIRYGFEHLMLIYNDIQIDDS